MNVAMNPVQSNNTLIDILPVGPQAESEGESAGMEFFCALMEEHSGLPKQETVAAPETENQVVTDGVEVCAAVAVAELPPDILAPTVTTSLEEEVDDVAMMELQGKSTQEAPVAPVREPLHGTSASDPATTHASADKEANDANDAQPLQTLPEVAVRTKTAPPVDPLQKDTVGEAPAKETVENPAVEEGEAGTDVLKAARDALGTASRGTETEQVEAGSQVEESVETDRNDLAVRVSKEGPAREVEVGDAADETDAPVAGKDGRQQLKESNNVQSNAPVHENGPIRSDRSSNSAAPDKSGPTAEAGVDRPTGEFSRRVPNEPERPGQARESGSQFAGGISEPARSDVLEPVRTTEQTRTLNETHFVDSVIRQCRLLTRPDGSSEMRLNLQPPELGSITLRLTLKDDHLQARVELDHPELRQVVETLIPRVRESLAGEGLDLDRFDIEARRHPEPQNDGQHSTSQGQDSRNNHRGFASTGNLPRNQPRRRITIQTPEGVMDFIV